VAKQFKPPGLARPVVLQFAVSLARPMYAWNAVVSEPQKKQPEQIPSRGEAVIERPYRGEKRLDFSAC
jgi:hypothetical protein